MRTEPATDTPELVTPSSGSQSSRSHHGQVVAERFAILEELGRGGMGIVYAASDLELGRKIALKVVHPDHATPAARARLLREAQALAQLQHPNVVTIFDVGSVGDTIFLAMELIEGLSLRDWLRAAPRGPTAIARAFAAAGRGLVAAHAAGMVHRDFKPDNVLVGADGSIRVVDFGLARFAPTVSEDDAASHSAEHLGALITRPGAIAGTPAYLAPELKAGVPADERADQFAFGVALDEALGAAAPARLRAVARRARAAAPDDRYPSMAAVVAALSDDPAARWRRATLGAGVGGVATLAAFALASVPGPTSDACRARDPFVDGVWDGAVRARLAAAHASGGLVETEALAQTTRQLDRYAADLLDGRHAACVAARRPDSTPLQKEARAACLDRRRADLLALAELAVHPDTDLAGYGLKAALGLSPVTDCADVDSLVLPTPLPSDSAARTTVREITDTLARGKVLIDGHRPTDARDLLEPTVAQAVVAGHGPTLAEAQLLLGFAFEDLGELPAAERSFRAALLAAQGGRADALVARIAASLAIHIGRLKRQPLEGRMWGELSLATARRLADPRAAEIRAHYALAIVAGGAHDADEAERQGRLSLTLAEHLYGQADFRLAEQLNFLGGIAMSRERLDDAEVLLERALAIQKDTMGQNNPVLIPIELNLASIASRRGDLTRSIPALQACKAQIETILGPDHYYLGTTLIVLARDLARTGNLDEAEAAAVRAEQIREHWFGSADPATVDARDLVREIQEARTRAN